MTRLHGHTVVCNGFPGKVDQADGLADRIRRNRRNRSKRQKIAMLHLLAARECTSTGTVSLLEKVNLYRFIEAQKQCNPAKQFVLYKNAILRRLGVDQ